MHQPGPDRPLPVGHRPVLGVEHLQVPAPQRRPDRVHPLQRPQPPGYHANDLTGWLAYEPSDPDHDLAASWHSYNFDPCKVQQCWTSQVSPVIAKVPVIAGEIGENDCADGYIDPLMAYLDSKSTSYLAWSWNAYGGCANAPPADQRLLGHPTPYGAGYRSHLQALAREHANRS